MPVASVGVRCVGIGGDTGVFVGSSPGPTGVTTGSHEALIGATICKGEMPTSRCSGRSADLVSMPTVGGPFPERPEL